MAPVDEKPNKNGDLDATNPQNTTFPAAFGGSDDELAACVGRCQRDGDP